MGQKYKQTNKQTNTKLNIPIFSKAKKNIKRQEHYVNLLCTTRVADLFSSLRILRAEHLYFPASSSRTSIICNRPSDVTLVLLLGNDPFTLDQDTLGAGFPVAEQERAAVLLSLTVSCEGDIVAFGTEIDSPGSPFIPGIPGGPMSPLIPFSPRIPGGPIIPCLPLRPGSPVIPWEPFLPLLPGGPGSPRGQTLKLPLFWQISLKLELTTSFKTAFMLAELLNGGLLEILRLILWSFVSLFASFLSESGNECDGEISKEKLEIVKRYTSVKQSNF